MRNILLALWLMLFATVAMAQDAAQRLEYRLNGLHSLQANFQQQVISDQGKVLQDASGKMSLLRPGRIYWEVAKPTHQVIVADGEKIWHYDVDLEQITVKSQASSIANTPALLLSEGQQSLTKDYRVENLPVDGDRIDFVLTPKDPNNIFTHIAMVFEGLTIQSMRLHDSLGQVTEVSFSKVKLNPKISAEQFRFSPPKGVDVVKLGQ